MFVVDDVCFCRRRCVFVVEKMLYAINVIRNNVMRNIFFVKRNVVRSFVVRNVSRRQNCISSNAFLL